MADAETVIALEGDPSGYLAKLETLPAKTAEAASRCQSALADKVGDGAKKASSHLATVSKEAGNLAKLGGLLGGQLGGALASTADSAELLSAGLSGSTMALGALAAGVGIALSLGSAIADVVTNVEAYDKHMRKLEETGNFFEAQRQDVHQLASEVDQLSDMWDEAKIRMTAAVGPIVSQMIKGTIGGLAYFRQFASGVFGRVGEVAGAAWDLMAGRGSTDELWARMQAVADVAEQHQTALDVALAATLRFDAAVEDHTATRQQEERAIRTVTAARVAEVKAIKDEIAALTTLDLQQLGAEWGAAMNDLGDRMAGIPEQMSVATSAALADLGDIFEAADRLEQQQREDRRARVVGTTEELLNVSESVVASLGQMWDALYTRQARGAERGSTAYRKAMLAQFRAQQGVAIASAAVNAALGITQIWAQHAAQPVVAAALTAIAGGVLAAEIATIAMAKPQVLHRGGMVRGAGSGPEVETRLLQGEAVLNREATRRLGPGRVEALNRGQDMHGGGVAIVAIDSQRLAAAMMGDGRGRRGTAARARGALAGRSSR